MNVLVIGKGGREHAIVDALRRSIHVHEIYCSPGNSGTNCDEQAINIRIEPGEEAKFAKRHDIGLTIVGPEGPLCDGIEDEFQAAGLRIFGPTKEGAQIEGSKAFSKELMMQAFIRF